MERRRFVRNCCSSAIGLPFATLILYSCGNIYYASYTQKKDSIVVAKSEFLGANNVKQRPFVLLRVDTFGFPICLYHRKEVGFITTLLKCTHRGCELNVGGGIYHCPCHGSEFSIEGKVLEGPAEYDLQTFRTVTDHENIIIYLS